MVQRIFADRIDEPVLAMRTEIPREELWELAEDIKANGLINPITVRPVGERYEVVAGHRRFLACRIAGVLNIPCVVRDVADAALLSIMASENLVRSDVDPVDEARFISRMMSEKNMSVGEVADTIRRSRQYVEDRLVVGGMPDYMHNFIKSGDLKLGVALELIGIEPDDKRRVWVGLAVQDNITVRTAQYWRYQHTLGTLPEIAPVDSSELQAPTTQPRVPMFVCALDGDEHPTSEMRMIAFSVQHAETINRLAEAIRIELKGTVSAPVSNVVPGL